MEINIEKNYKDKFSNLWDDSRFSTIEILNRGYVFDEIVLKNSLLFLGINPSFDEKENVPERSFYNNTSHPYFRKFPDISEQTGLRWSHLDLLGVRETKQNKISELLKTQNGVEFIAEHLSISKEIIISAQPKIIVVSNTLARHFMGYDKKPEKNEGIWMNFDFDFDTEIGTYRIKSKELFGTPIFFTSMLTGQRALDKGSFKRLIWHIDFVNRNNLVSR